MRNLFTFGGLARAALRPARFRSTTTEVQDVLATLYRSIHAVTGARLVVDTSKWPLDPTLLVPPEGVASFGVHLVRHPSDVAASWARIKRFPDTGEAMPTFGSLHTSASWTARNLAAEWAGKRVDNRMVRVRYEDFVANPRTTVETILSSTGFPADPSSLIHDDGYVDLKPGHTVMGNPSRFDHGSVRIAPQGGTTNRLVEALTLPLRRRYSYARSARD